MGREQGQRGGYPVDHLPTVLRATSQPALALRLTAGEITIVGVNDAWSSLCGIPTADLVRRTPALCMSEALVATLSETLIDPDAAETRTIEPSPDRLVGASQATLKITAFEPDDGRRFFVVIAAPIEIVDRGSRTFGLGALTHPVLLVDRHHLITYANDGAVTLTGLSLNELLGADVETLFHPESHDVILGHFARATSAPKSVRAELELRSPRRRIQVEVTAGVVRDPEPSLVVGLIDIEAQEANDLGHSDRASLDELTGLSSRKAFVDHVRDVASSSEPRELTVAFLDIDNFKNINDALGHDQGDVVLQTIAQRLTHLLANRGIVARFGGDEFVVATAEPRGTGDAELRHLLGRAFGDPISLDGTEFQVTSSVGIVTVVDPEEMNPDAILKFADIAMYEAKRRGKDCVAVYDESLQSRAKARLKVESDLRQAIEGDEFTLHYQPIIDVITGRAVGSEALVRWIHPERGMVPPDQFIPIAEETGLIIPLGAWVLNTAIGQAAEWNQRRLTRRALGVSVNLSGRQFDDSELEQRIHAALSRHGFDPSKLTLEVTESTLMTDVDGTFEVLTRLRELGIKIAIDDFGTGYSSLAYLKRLPASSLKVDKAFVDGLGTKPEDTALVTGIIGLASALDLEIVAEGVEGALQLRELRRLGCEYSQGYFHSRPLPADDFEAWISGSDPGPGTRSTQLPGVPQTAITPPAEPPPQIRRSFDPPPEPEEATTVSPLSPPLLFDQDIGQDRAG